MYTEEYERRGFPLRDFLLKLILVIIFVFLLIWLLPKFIKPTVNNYTADSSKVTASESSSKKSKECTSGSCDLSGLDALTSQIFAQNIDRMKDAAISYYTDERLPENVGDSETMTLNDMIGKKIILALIDKNNKAVDVEKSYVKITKVDDEYILKVNLKDSEKEDYILVHLGCYTYCDSYVCQKQSTNVPIKGSKVTDTVPIKGSYDNGTYIPPKTPSVVVTPSTEGKHYCVVYNGRYYGKDGYAVSKSTYIDDCIGEVKRYCVVYDGKYYGKDGNVVSKSDYKKQCTEEEKHYCVIYNGKYYGKDGDKVSKSEFIKQCTEEEEKHYCVKFNGDYYGRNGDKVSKGEYIKQCTEEEKHYCVVYNGDYYGKNGDKVSKSEYINQCTEPVEEKHQCAIVNGKYYGVDGTVVTKSEYVDQCLPKEEEKHYCAIVDGKYYDDEGNVVSKSKYEEICLGIVEEHICTKFNGEYYGLNGEVVSYSEYKDQCEHKKEYIYEYKKVTAAKFSSWTNWSDWSKTSCTTKEINCADTDITCLKKLQRYDRKEKVGTYQKSYEKTRTELVQTGSYTQKACSKYNYVEINKTIYATTTTTTYTTINTITSTTRSSNGSWTYNGRASYSNPPRDTANTHYKFVGADYSYCADTCTTLPNYYYDSYTYNGGLSSVANTTVTPYTTSSTSSNTTSTTTTSGDASCGEYVYKTIPVYGTITVTDKDYRTEPLYGTVCYQSTKTRKLLQNASVQYVWSTHNDTTLLNDGWFYTGNYKLK